MPYRSPEQARLMRAVANSPGFAKKVGIPQSVGKKFEADKAEGGTVKESKKMMGKELAFLKAKKAPKSMIKHEEKEAKGKPFAKGGGIESKGKTKGKMVKMAYGGKAC
jgi:hypothetical protein